MSTSASISDCTSAYGAECFPKSSGYSLRGIFGLFGVGYSSSTFDFGIDNAIDLRINLTAVDFSLSFLDAMITAGVGPVLSGELAGSGHPETSGITYSGGSASGTTTFLNFGFGLGLVELIAGYRMWDATESGGKYSYSSGSGDVVDQKPKYSEMTLGVGVGF